MITTDFLVIGSGIAGLTYALDVAEHGTVTVLCKGAIDEGNTAYAQGGIASVTAPDDSFAAHIDDTLECGAGLCDRGIVEAVIRGAPAAIEFLGRLGVRFDRETAGEGFQLGREGGHSARRILHVGDSTGAAIQRGVAARAREHRNITILEHHLAIDLILSPDDLLEAPPQSGQRGTGDGRCVCGAYTLNRSTGAILAIGSRVTMLASGGIGKVYLYTTNPDVATGDGVAMAFRAGATVANMEFIQFHPTCLYHPHAKTFLITEAMRGEGAILKTIRGHRFMQDYHPKMELAPRDVVARAIDDQMKKSGDDYVLLDISHRDRSFLEQRFPTIYARTRELGFDIASGPIPVVPATHYCCGGVETDGAGRTTLPRLFCAGEAACTGLHGANRLASNSLLEAIVFARWAADASIRALPDWDMPSGIREWDPLDTIPSSEEVLVSYFWDEVRRLMWNLVGIVRSDKWLRLAASRLALIKQDVRDYYWRFTVTSDLVELRNIIQVAELIVCSASRRRESRGLHFNIDVPHVDDERWLRNTEVVAEPR